MPVNQKLIIRFLSCFFPCVLMVCLLCFFSVVINAQETTVRNDNLIPINDLGDFVTRVLNKKVDTTKAPKKSGMTILPSIGYNPSFGFVIGAKISAIKQYGAPENTSLSSFGLEGIYSTKGVVTGQARHNVFTEANKWNFQGNWQLSKFLIADYGIGTGNKDYLNKTDSAFLIKFNYIRLTEKVYTKIGRSLYAGGGISINYRYKINDEKLETLSSTPHYRYSLRNNFNPTK